VWVRVATVAAFTVAASAVAVAFVRGGPWDGPPPRLSWRPAPVLPEVVHADWTDVACPAPGDCWSVGSATGPDIPERSVLLGHLTDGAWRAVPTPGVTGAGGSDAQLTSVACSARSDCWAVGHLDDPSRSVRENGVLLLHYDGSTWTPDTAFAEPRTHLRATRCAPRGDCYVVGHTYGGDGRQAQPLVARYHLGTWTRLGGDARVGGYLSSLSCPAPGQCWAAGRTRDGADSLVVRVGGDTWRTTAPAPDDTDVAAALRAGIDPRVSCPRVRLCHILSAGADAGTVVTADGLRWTVDRAGSLTGLPNASGEVWSGFGCFSPGFCWVVGLERRPSTDDTPIAYLFDGQRWLRQDLTVADGGGARLRGALSFLACPTPAACWLLGAGTDGRSLAFHGG
jgi:hypothetical protein